MSPEDTGDLEAAEKTQFVDSYNELCNTGEQLKTHSEDRQEMWIQVGSGLSKTCFPCKKKKKKVKTLFLRVIR